MKNRATMFLKQVIAILSSIAKSKSMAIKNKTNAVRARLLVFSMMKNKKVMFGSLTDKIQGLLRHKDNDEDNKSESNWDQNKALVLYNCHGHSLYTEFAEEQVDRYSESEDYESKYPDLTHCLFDGEYQEFDDPGGSIIELVKNSKEGNGEDFKLEDEIDHAADLFIMRFHKQMRLQKLESFKRHQEKLKKSV